MELGARVARTGHPLPAGFATCSGRGPHQPPVPATTPSEDQLGGAWLPESHAILQLFPAHITVLLSRGDARLRSPVPSRPGPNPRPPALVTQVPRRVLASQRRQLDPTGSCK